MISSSVEHNLGSDLQQTAHHLAEKYLVSFERLFLQWVLNDAVQNCHPPFSFDNHNELKNMLELDGFFRTWMH